ncbi:uncharacterized protein JN550_001512 [Neoarthrinium moseri]|uniref:uncharacterized protein n=1 Tax=Neoarthrinium moseri TaxID=1658444 RepID=UPI001FDC54AA|nr:uncharacterized protein JN550_001512 [Neoarthrinium moseri]KAI1876016.1 hypothetical protein JN550_001512 [Neoarthrinium moseri]
MAPSRAPTKPFAYCEGAPKWDPEAYIADRDLHARAAAHLARDDFASAVAESFALPARDAYVYHAIVSVTLAQVQHVVGLGPANRLHAWYQSPAPPADDGDGQQPSTAEPLPPPPKADIQTYLQIFDPKTATPNILKTLSLNAKKGSLRASVAAHLLSKRYLHPSVPGLQIPRSKSGAPVPNPYLDFLAWACLNLEYAGPCPESEAVRSSHHVLPVLMHHFGCACPSHEALTILKHVAAGREVWDVGSGNGYWTFMLRAYGVGVRAVDSAQSSWRATWIRDTVVADGVAYLGRNGGGRDAVLLLVYPIVGGGLAGGAEGGFTRDLVRAYAGDTLAVVGTQNHNGYTGFRGMSMDEYMAREQPGWTKTAQVPLPSFPGKDEALFVFQRGERAPKPAQGDGSASA